MIKTKAAESVTLQEHLKSIDACAPARKWAGDRTARQAWDECEYPDWLIWWVVRARPEWRQRAALLLVRELRARTLDRAGELYGVSAAALDAAEAWALDPCDAAADATATAAAAAYAAADAADADADAAAAADFRGAAANAAAERRLWLSAIRAEFECPWMDGRRKGGSYTTQTKD